jgi:hypothetical protein
MPDLITQTDERGTPAAIADCRQRLATAISTAHRELARQMRDEEGLNADDFEDTRDYETDSDSGDESR